MGLVSGSAGFVRYSLEDELPENFWEFAAEQVARFSFKDIDDTFDEYSVGWVSPLNMFDSEFAYASHAVGDYIFLAMRTDERRVPPSILNKFVMKEEEQVKRERQVPKLSRAHRQEIKENVRLQLIKKAIPTPSVYDMCWNLADNVILFFSTNKKAQAVFEDLFKDCFGQTPLLQVPYLTAGHLLEPEEQEVLADLHPSLFV